MAIGVLILDLCRVKVLQGMKKAGKNNPLFLLDELDKLGADLAWRSYISAIRGSRPSTKQCFPGSLYGKPILIFLM